MTRYTVVYTSPPFISNARVCGNITGKNRIPPYTARRRPPSVRSVRDAHHQQNLMAATLIAADPMAYPEGSLSALWSDVVLSKAAEPDDSEAGSLFDRRRAA